MRRAASGSVRFTLDDGVGRIVLSNEQRLNAMTRGMWDALRDALLELTSSPGLRVISIRGEGDKAYSSGSDIRDLIPRSGDQEGVHAINECIQESLEALESVPVPTVAEIRGYCLGAGTAIAVACDLRLLRDDVVIGIPAAKLGVGYDPRWIFSLVRVVGVANASRLIYTGEKYDALEAKRMGFATEVFTSSEFDSMAAQLIQRISRNAPLTIRAAKQAMLRADRSGDPIEMRSLVEVANSCFMSGDFKRGVDAFSRGLIPGFEGR